MGYSKSAINMSVSFSTASPYSPRSPDLQIKTSASTTTMRSTTICFISRFVMLCPYTTFLMRCL